MSIYLYSLFIPNLFLSYVSLNLDPNSPINLQQAKATYYKSLSDALPFLSLFLFRPILTRVSNRFGRKKIFYFGISTLILDVMSCWVSIKTQNLIYFYVVHSIFGIFNIVGLNNNLISNTIFSYIDDISSTSNNNKSKLYLISTSFFNIGVIIGPVIYIFTMMSKNLNFTLYIIIALLVQCLCLIMFLNETVDQTIMEADIGGNLNCGETTTINPFKTIVDLFKLNNIDKYMTCIIMLYISILYTGQDSVSTYYYYCNLMFNWGAKEHGLFVSSLGVTMLFWSLIVVPLSTRLISTRKVITIGLFISLCGHIFFSFSTKSQYFYLVGGLLGTFVPNNIILLLNIISTSTIISKDIKKTTASVQSVGALSMFFGSMGSNDIFRFSISDLKHFLPQLVYFINGIIVFITLTSSLFIWLLFKKQRPVNTMC